MKWSVILTVLLVFIAQALAAEQDVKDVFLKPPSLFFDSGSLDEMSGDSSIQIILEHIRDDPELRELGRTLQETRGQGESASTQAYREVMNKAMGNPELNEKLTKLGEMMQQNPCFQEVVLKSKDPGLIAGLKNITDKKLNLTTPEQQLLLMLGKANAEEILAGSVDRKAKKGFHWSGRVFDWKRPDKKSDDVELKEAKKEAKLLGKLLGRLGYLNKLRNFANNHTTTFALAGGLIYTIFAATTGALSSPSNAPLIQL